MMRHLATTFKWLKATLNRHFWFMIMIRVGKNFNLTSVTATIVGIGIVASSSFSIGITVTSSFVIADIITVVVMDYTYMLISAFAFIVTDEVKAYTTHLAAFNFDCYDFLVIEKNAIKLAWNSGPSFYVALNCHSLRSSVFCRLKVDH